MIEVLPAIIPKSFANLKETLEKVIPYSSLVQIDAVDGVFVPAKMWPYGGISDIDFTKIINEEEGFPFWEQIDFEADLMVSEPEKKVWDWIKAGAKSVILHIESSKNIPSLVDELKKNAPVKESPFYVGLGIALNTETPNETIYPFIDSGKVDFIQCMGIAKIGFQGQPFDERVLAKISDFRKRYPNIIIAVDGAVNLETAPRLVKAGANKLISGSAILESGDIMETIKKLRESGKVN